MSQIILVIEDNPKHSFLFEEILVDEGYDVEIAQNGVEAAKKMEESNAKDKPYDLVLMDISVPGFNAIEFIKAYKEVYRILVVSAYAEGDNIKPLLEEKWRIKKPFDVNVVIERVKQRLTSPV